MTEPAVPPTGDLRRRVLDALGTEICAGAIEAGTVFTTDSIETRFGVSRPVVREALRALQVLGLVSPRRRVGVRVMPLPEWNVYDPQVIRWRMAGPHRLDQLRALTELRSAVEPTAARLAASRASFEDAGELVGIAGRLWAAGRGGDAGEFLALDAVFHRRILAMSGNEMFAQLHSVIEEVLHGRTRYGLMPHVPSPEALQWHVDIANAVQTGDGQRAADAMTAITRRSLEEMSAIWEGRDASDT
ncbi:FadR/GntR family transcriptional regulator [Microbacterium sp. NPDC055903]